MPGTPATTPNFGIPRYAGGDPADFPTQYNAGVDQIDDAVQDAIQASAIQIFGPALPAVGPGYLTDIYYKTPQAIAGGGFVDSYALWHLRYDSVTSDANKWRFLGGAPMLGAGYAGADPSTAWIDTAVVTAPLAGIYRVQAIFDMLANTGTNNFAIGFAATTPSVFSVIPAVVGRADLLAPDLNCGAGDIVSLKMRKGAGGNALSLVGGSPRLELTPIRVH